MVRWSEEKGGQGGEVRGGQEQVWRRAGWTREVATWRGRAVIGRACRLGRRRRWCRRSAPFVLRARTALCVCVRPEARPRRSRCFEDPVPGGGPRRWFSAICARLAWSRERRARRVRHGLSRWACHVRVVIAPSLGAEGTGLGGGGPTARSFPPPSKLPTARPTSVRLQLPSRGRGGSTPQDCPNTAICARLINAAQPDEPSLYLAAHTRRTRDT